MKKKGTSPPIVKVVALALRHVMTTPYFLVKNFIWFRNSAYIMTRPHISYRPSRHVSALANDLSSQRLLSPSQDPMASE